MFMSRVLRERHVVEANGISAAFSQFITAQEFLFWASRQKDEASRAELPLRILGVRGVGTDQSMLALVSAVVLSLSSNSADSTKTLQPQVGELQEDVLVVLYSGRWSPYEPLTREAVQSHKTFLIEPLKARFGLQRAVVAFAGTASQWCSPQAEDLMPDGHPTSAAVRLFALEHSWLTSPFEPPLPFAHRTKRFWPSYRQRLAPTWKWQQACSPSSTRRPSTRLCWICMVPSSR